MWAGSAKCIRRRVLLSVLAPSVTVNPFFVLRAKTVARGGGSRDKINMVAPFRVPGKA